MKWQQAVVRHPAAESLLRGRMWNRKRVRGNEWCQFRESLSEITVRYLIAEIADPVADRGVPFSQVDLQENWLVRERRRHG